MIENQEATGRDTERQFFLRRRIPKKQITINSKISQFWSCLFKSETHCQTTTRRILLLFEKIRKIKTRLIRLYLVLGQFGGGWRFGFDLKNDVESNIIHYGKRVVSLLQT
jgi:hypothetical protein